MSVDEYFESGPAHERAVFDAVMDHVGSLGPVHVEPVSVGIFLKRNGRFASLRPMRRWVALSFSLDRRVTHPRITRKVIPHGGRYYHVVNVREPSDIDDDIRDWLTESYQSS